MSKNQFVTEGKRIEHVRRLLNLKPTEIAKVMNIGYTTYNQYEKGNIRMSVNLLQYFGEKGVNLNYLLMGEGEVMLEKRNEELFQKLKELQKLIN